MTRDRHTRRAVLATFGSAITAVAGCVSRGDSSSRDTATAPTDNEPTRTATPTPSTPAGTASDPFPYPETTRTFDDVFVTAHTGTFAYTPRSVWTLRTMPTDRFFTASPPGDWPAFDEIREVRLASGDVLAAMTFSIVNVGSSETPPPRVTTRFGIDVGDGAVRRAGGEVEIVPVGFPDVTPYEVSVANLVGDPAEYALYSVVRTPDVEPLAPGAQAVGWAAVPFPTTVDVEGLRLALGHEVDGTESYPARWSSGFGTGANRLLPNPG